MAPDRAWADCRSRTDAVLLSPNRLRASSAFASLVRGYAGGLALRVCADQIVRQSVSRTLPGRFIEIHSSSETKSLYLQREVARR
jgi:hypothetical protein